MVNIDMVPYICDSFPWVMLLLVDNSLFVRQNSWDRHRAHQSEYIWVTSCTKKIMEFENEGWFLDGGHCELVPYLWGKGVCLAIFGSRVVGDNKFESWGKIRTPEAAIGRRLLPYVDIAAFYGQWIPGLHDEFLPDSDAILQRCFFNLQEFLIRYFVV